MCKMVFGSPRNRWIFSAQWSRAASQLISCQPDAVFSRGFRIRLGLRSRRICRRVLAHMTPRVNGLSGFPNSRSLPSSIRSITSEQASGQSKVQAVSLRMFIK
jgi:hypothetical protein